MPALLLLTAPAPAPYFHPLLARYWIYLVWNNKYLWQWKVVLDFKFTKFLHNLKLLDSRHRWHQVNMSVIGKCWLYIAGHILEIKGSVQYWPERTLFYENRHFFWKRGPPTYLIPFLNILHQNKALYNFCKKGQLSLIGRNIDLKYALYRFFVKT